MSKGLFSQGVVLLTDGGTTIGDVASVLRSRGFEIARQLPPNEDWRLGGATLIVPYLPNVNGYAAIDVVDRPWPDSMGDPTTDANTFAAWSMGYFGPFAFPRALERAQQHARCLISDPTVAESHGGFIRLRLSYAFGSEDEATVLPQDYDPLAELMFLSRAALGVFDVPGVLCYFNPNGEVLCDRAKFVETLNLCEQQRNIPMPLWSNVRFFNLDESLALMDTVGNAQLDIRDVEVLCPHAMLEPNEIARYLRNLSFHLLAQAPDFRTGESIDGPGDSGLLWTVEMHDQGIVDPSRPVGRIYPQFSSEAIQESLRGIGLAAG